MKNALLVLLAICFASAASAQQYSVNAKITGFPNGTKFYLTDTDLDTNIDSAIVKDNAFSFKGKLRDTPLSLWVTTTVDKKFYYFTLLMGKIKLPSREILRIFHST